MPDSWGRGSPSRPPPPACTPSSTSPNRRRWTGRARRWRRRSSRAVSRGKLTAGAREALIGRISYTTDIDELAAVDAVIEAVTEDPRVKGKLFARLDELLPEARFLASNTSSIPIAELAAWTQRPERVLGLHFFSPVPVMKLVEVVSPSTPSEETITEAESFAAQIGKQAIQTKDRSGFIVNMLLVPYLMAAVRMYEDGFATREDIDEGMRLGCGHPDGPADPVRLHRPRRPLRGLRLPV